jgi:hypothetical protein
MVIGGRWRDSTLNSRFRHFTVTLLISQQSLLIDATTSAKSSVRITPIDNLSLLEVNGINGCQTLRAFQSGGSKSKRDENRTSTESEKFCLILLIENERKETARMVTEMEIVLIITGSDE